MHAPAGRPALEAGPARLASSAGSAAGAQSEENFRHGSNLNRMVSESTRCATRNGSSPLARGKRTRAAAPLHQQNAKLHVSGS